MSDFHYAAYSYLDEWMSKDLEFHRLLASDREPPLSSTEGAACLVEVAKDYGVIRTLKNIGETPRLIYAYEALQEIDAVTMENFVEKVCSLAETLGKPRGTLALSAASKFLWVRFRSPVIIYDSIVAAWLQKRGYRDDNYSNYCRIWTIEYLDCASQVEMACAELSEIKRFTLAAAYNHDELSALTNSEWFKQRVFDHFVLCASSKQSGQT